LVAVFRILLQTFADGALELRRCGGEFLIALVTLVETLEEPRRESLEIGVKGSM